VTNFDRDIQHVRHEHTHNTHTHRQTVIMRTQWKLKTVV